MVFVYAFLFIVGFSICSYLFGCCVALAWFICRQLIILVFRLIRWVLKSVFRMVRSIPKGIRYLMQYIKAYIDIFRYESSSYYKETNKSYLEVLTDKGSNGEYRCYAKLRHLEKDGARFLFNLYLPKADGTTSELDVLMIHRTGLYVLESKNRKGYVIGDPSTYKWKQITNHGSFDFYNPLFQNEGHMNTLCEMITNEVNIQPMTVFTYRYNLMSKDKEYPICNIRDLDKRMESLVDSFPITISNANVDYLYECLSKYTTQNVDASVKQTHLDV